MLLVFTRVIEISQWAIPRDNVLPDSFVDDPALKRKQFPHNNSNIKTGRCVVYGKTNTETTDLQNINMIDTIRCCSIKKKLVYNNGMRN